jgi:hypothetical protein
MDVLTDVLPVEKGRKRTFDLTDKTAFLMGRQLMAIIRRTFLPIDKIVKPERKFFVGESLV